MVAGCKAKETTETTSTNTNDATAVGAPGPSGVHVKAAADLRAVIANRYSHRDQRGVDWDKAFAVHSKQLETSATASEFAQHTAKLLSLAGDTHISVIAEGATKPIYPHAPKLAFNFDLEAAKSAVNDLEQIDVASPLARSTNALATFSFEASCAPTVLASSRQSTLRGQRWPNSSG